MWNKTTSILFYLSYFYFVTSSPYSNSGSRRRQAVLKIKPRRDVPRNNDKNFRIFFYFIDERKKYVVIIISYI